MLQIRTGVFETNSSSTHSLTICDANDFEKFKNVDFFKTKLVHVEPVT